MQTAERILDLSFDSIRRRYTGSVLVVGPDGRERRVPASVHGQPGWSMERIARMLIGAARFA